MEIQENKKFLYNNNLSNDENLMVLFSESIEFFNENKKSFNYPLFNFINSDGFDMNLLLYYLQIKEEKGIIDVLINTMQKRFINESFFYLPQLCWIISFKQHFHSIETYILERCVNQLKFSLEVSWLVSSFLEDDSQTNSSYYNLLFQRIETTLVNGRRSTLPHYKQFLQSQNLSTEETIKNSINKQIRLEYFNICSDFYNKLKKMCESLKDIPKEPPYMRNNSLKYKLEQLNNDIRLQRNRQNQETHKSDNLITNFFKGIILPFDDSKSTEDEYISLMVRFIPKHSTCLSTRGRVPVKIIVETIKTIECEDWDLLYDPGKEFDDCDEKSPFQNRSGSLNLFPNKTSQTPKSLKVFKSLSDFFDDIQNQDKDMIKKKNDEENLIDMRRKSKIDQGYFQRFQEKSKDKLMLCLNDKIEEIFGKKYSLLCDEIKENSPFRRFKTYSVKSFIAKSDDDLRQELMAMQLIKKFHEVFVNAGLGLKLHPYEILVTSSSSGLIELIPNSLSIDRLKKRLTDQDLNKFYRTYFENFEEAQKNFVESLAAYSLVCYLVQIKDRHNGNILIDMNGYIVHIDFGFILSISPGNLGFEKAPFKITQEYIDIMDGLESPFLSYFKSLILRGLIELRKHVDTFVKIVEIMSKNSKMPCFKIDPETTISNFKDRFLLNKNEKEIVEFVDEMIETSIKSWTTSQYDYYQKLTNGISP